MGKKFREIVAGTRIFYDYEMLARELLSFIDDIADEMDSLEFVSGTAKGADTLGEQFAHTYGYQVKRFPAKWHQYGKIAGPIRNRQMAEYASKETGILFVFWDGCSRGTKNMIELAEQYGLEIHVIKYIS